MYLSSAVAAVLLAGNVSALPASLVGRSCPAPVTSYVTVIATATSFVDSLSAAGAPSTMPMDTVSAAATSSMAATPSMPVASSMPPPPPSAPAPPASAPVPPSSAPVPPPVSMPTSSVVAAAIASPVASSSAAEATTVAAASTDSDDNVDDSNGLSISASVIQAISPGSASCNGAPFAAQCRTAAQAAGPISRSFATYGIKSKAEAAALISLMAFESVDFKYNVNVSPGRPGQGTRNMQMINFNILYAQSIPALRSQVSSITGGAAGASLSADKANAVRGLLIANDNYDFGSAAWFLTTQCPAAIRTQLQTGSVAGWQQYITSCVGTTVTDARQAYWTRAIAAIH